jgi:hypothetical protein
MQCKADDSELEKNGISKQKYGFGKLYSEIILGYFKFYSYCMQNWMFRGW